MSKDMEALRAAYSALAELWCSPRDADLLGAARQASEALRCLDAEAAGLLARFLETPVAEEAYVDLFELDPPCPLYLGHHSFEEPKTCAKAGVSDRNGYMAELLGIFGHFGFSPNGRDLPDYLPLLIEFLSLVADQDDPVREKLVREYLLPHLPRLRAKLAELEAPHLHLLDALLRVLELDLSLPRNLCEGAIHA